jgi:peptide/nickel transport system ATP-binding protein
MSADVLVRARDLSIKFVSRDATVQAVNGVDFDLKEKEALCILGESGSGKSVTLRSLLRLNPPKKTVMAGSLTVCGEDMVNISDARLNSLRGRLVSMIFQEPMTALDPVFTIGRQIAETIVRHEGISRADADRRALDLLELVQIPSAKRRLAAYPHVQIQVLLLLHKLQQELGMGIIFVTHDLGVAGEIADRIAVMYAGRFVEEGPVRDVMRTPMHPYTRGLLGATVHAGLRGKRLTTIPGAPPDLSDLPPGCAFAPRCSDVTRSCTAEVPTLHKLGPERGARCVMAEAIA